MRYIYAIIDAEGLPIGATESREHAFEICRGISGKDITFSGWVDGAISHVTKRGELIAKIYCIEIST